MFAGFLTGAYSRLSLPKEGTKIYYPYQVRAMMPLTGLEINPCGINDCTISVEFRDGEAISYEKDNLDYPHDLVYVNTDNGVILYQDADSPSIYIGFNKDGLCEAWQIGDNAVYTDYTFEDHRGEAQGYRENRNNPDNDFNSHNRESSTRQSTTCLKCGGTGWDPQRWTHATGAYYYNSSGSRCPYCNYSDKHYHYKCYH